MPKIEDLSMKRHVYEYIRDKILRLELMPGDRIPEHQIAVELGISRTPVREAVRLLAWEGLVNVNPNHSATVVVVDRKMLQDLLLVRWQHDCLAIPLAVYNGSNRDFAQLREIAEMCIRENDTGNLWRRHELDAEFHRQIMQIGKNRILIDMYARLTLGVRLWQALHLTEPEMLRDKLEQHLELVDCLEKRETKRALQIVHDHTETSYGTALGEDFLKPVDLGMTV